MRIDRACRRSQESCSRGTDSVAYSGNLKPIHGHGMRTSLFVVSVSALMLAACGESTSPRIAGLGGSTNSPPGNASSNTNPLVISPSQIQLVVGGKFQLSTNAPTSLQAQVQWASLQPAVATVSQTGMVTAVTPGTTIVTARYSFDSTHVASATINVTLVTMNTGQGGMSGASGVP